MAIQQAGSAQAKIKEVAVEEARAERTDDEGLTYAVHDTWTALRRRSWSVPTNARAGGDRPERIGNLERIFGQDAGEP